VQDPTPQDEVAHLLSSGRRRWRREGDLEGARADFGRALELDPRCAQAWNDRGCLNAEQGQLDRALKDLFEARRLDPDLAEAARNYALLASLIGPDAPQRESALSTLSGALVTGQGSSFAEGLVRYLQAHVEVPARDEGHRADAIQEVVLRVIGLARSEDLPLAEALAQLRRSSTRSWVRRLVALARRRDGAELPPEEVLPAVEASPEDEESEQGSLRLDGLLNSLRDEVLARSQSSTRWRRRVVWDVFVGGLVEGVHLQRKEVIAAVRALGIKRGRAGDGVIEADLDLISAALKRGPRSQ
jgi:hypothetical protein